MTWTNKRVGAMRFLLAAIMLGFWPALQALPVAAQDIAFSQDTVRECLAGAWVGAGGPQDCVGMAADECMGATSAGNSTVGMGACLGAELEFWDGELNAVYRALRQAEARLDAEVAEAGLEVAPVEPELQEMQRAWIAYRDALCIYEYAKWQGGTGGGPAESSCRLHETARQALVLKARLDEMDR